MEPYRLRKLLISIDEYLRRSHAHFLDRLFEATCSEKPSNLNFACGNQHVSVLQKAMPVDYPLIAIEKPPGIEIIADYTGDFIHFSFAEKNGYPVRILG